MASLSQVIHVCDGTGIVPIINVIDGLPGARTMVVQNASPITPDPRDMSNPPQAIPRTRLQGHRPSAPHISSPVDITFPNAIGRAARRRPLTQQFNTENPTNRNPYRVEMKHHDTRALPVLLRSTAWMLSRLSLCPMGRGPERWVQIFGV